MNKIILFIVCLPGLAYSQITLLQESFNNGLPTGWSMIDEDGLTPNSNVNVNYMINAFNVREDYDSTGMGDSILVSTSWFTNPGNASDYLILPSVTLGNFGNIFSLDAKSKDMSYPDGFRLLYSTSGITAADFNSNPVLFDTIAAPPYWTNIQIPIDSSLNGQTVTFAIQHYANDMFVLAIDNVKIEKESTSNIVATTNVDLKITQIKKVINITGNSELHHFQLFDLSGKMIANGTARNNVDFTMFEGIYILKIDNYYITKIALF